MTAADQPGRYPSDELLATMNDEHTADGWPHLPAVDQPTTEPSAVLVRHVYEGERCRFCGANVHDADMLGIECVPREPLVHTSETPAAATERDGRLQNARRRAVYLDGYRLDTGLTMDERHVLALGDEVSRLEAVAMTQAARLAKQERDAERDCDAYERVMETADRLAYDIAPMEVIGEHSSGNDPWENALDALADERRQHAAEVARLEGVVAQHSAMFDGFIRSLAIANGRSDNAERTAWGLPTVEVKTLGTLYCPVTPVITPEGAARAAWTRLRALADETEPESP